MIIQRTASGNFVRIIGDPHLRSLDDTSGNLLSQIPPEKLADYGVYQVEPYRPPAGYRTLGGPRYEMQDGRLVELFETAEDGILAVPARPGQVAIIGTLFPITVGGGKIRMGCDERSTEEWRTIDDATIERAHGAAAVGWWAQYRTAVLAMADAIDA